MGITQLTGKYARLREELASAYTAPVWHSGMIDRLTEEIFETERELASCQQPLWRSDDEASALRANDA